MSQVTREISIRRLLQRAPLDSRAVDEFLESRTTPLVEGTAATFLYRGEADAVRLRHFAHGLPWERSFRRVDRTDLWYLVTDVPEESRIEYKLEVIANGEERWIEDPLNPLRACDPFGANSVLRATGYEVPDWTRPDPEARGGRLEEVTIRSRALRRNFRVTMYLPAGFQKSRRHPLLVVHDGGDYLEYSDLKTVLDNLIHRLETAEIVAALVHPRRRLEEYTANPDHSRFLTEELVPRLENRYRLSARPEGRGLMGASMGAVSSLHAAWSYPEFYGRVLIQSGSYASSDGCPPPREPLLEPIVGFLDSYRDHPIPLADRVYMSCGIYEPLILVNRPLVPVLQSTGMEVRYTEARDGHNWENWRDRTREALSWLFPGPLWMVYE